MIGENKPYGSLLLKRLLFLIALSLFTLFPVFVWVLSYFLPGGAKVGWVPTGVDFLVTLTVFAVSLSWSWFLQVFTVPRFFTFIVGYAGFISNCLISPAGESVLGFANEIRECWNDPGGAAALGLIILLFGFVAFSIFIATPFCLMFTRVIGRGFPKAIVIGDE